MRNKRTNRRCFLKTTATALAAPYVIPATVLGAPGRPGANDRIRVGLIGAGHRSLDLTKESPADLQARGRGGLRSADDRRLFGRIPAGHRVDRQREMFAVSGLPADAGQGETRRRLRGDHHPRPSSRLYPCHAGRARRLRGEAAYADDRGRAASCPRRAEVPARFSRWERSSDRSPSTTSGAI